MSTYGINWDRPSFSNGQVVMYLDEPGTYRDMQGRVMSKEQATMLGAFDWEDKARSAQKGQ